MSTQSISELLANQGWTPERISKALKNISGEERIQLDNLIIPYKGPGIDWQPLPGPQTWALESKADILLYGGAAGGGKSDLLLGLSLTRQRRSIIFRTEFTQLKYLIDRSSELVKGYGKYNSQRKEWRLHDGRMLEFGAVQHERDVDKYQGRPHDFIGLDEAVNFRESQFRFLTGWLRTNIPGQRCRIVCASNPPVTSDGEWVIGFWAPWLDDQHPNPAKPGELRWYAMLDGKDTELETGGEFWYKGELIAPRSRTFIPARLTDNPYYMLTGYGSVLQNLPEPLRSMMLYGDFKAGIKDDPWQVIPTAWIKAAQKRWQPDKPENTPLTAIGVDVAYGGADKTVIIRRYGGWFALPEKFPGAQTPDGPSTAAKFVPYLAKEGGYANVDGLGYGASAVDSAKGMVDNKRRVRAILFSESAPGQDSTKTFSFTNMRAYAYWMLREALDPSNPDSANIALPPDPEVLADLTCIRWEPRSNGIQMESKEDIKKRLGRSPDVGDALVLAWLTLPKHTTKISFV